MNVCDEVNRDPLLAAMREREAEAMAATVREAGQAVQRGRMNAAGASGLAAFGLAILAWPWLHMKSG